MKNFNTTVGFLNRMMNRPETPGEFIEGKGWIPHPGHLKVDVMNVGTPFRFKLTSILEHGEHEISRKRYTISEFKAYLDGINDILWELEHEKRENQDEKGN